MKRPQVNIAPVKRVARIFVGLAGTIDGLAALGLHIQISGERGGGCPMSGGKGHGHRLMAACCIPMLVIAIVLVATGVAARVHPRRDSLHGDDGSDDGHVRREQS